MFLLPRTTDLSEAFTTRPLAIVLGGVGLRGVLWILAAGLSNCLVLPLRPFSGVTRLALSTELGAGRSMPELSENKLSRLSALLLLVLLLVLLLSSSLVLPSVSPAMNIISNSPTLADFVLPPPPPSLDAL